MIALQKHGIVEDKKPLMFIECKYNETNVSSQFRFLKKKYPQVSSYQLTYNSKKDFINQDGVRICDAYKIINEILKELEG